MALRPQGIVTAGSWRRRSPAPARVPASLPEAAE